ncbi:hypothetical protein EMCRGX_G010300 [Ephydatia muelleri]
MASESSAERDSISYSLYGGAISTHGADTSLHQLNEHEATKNKGGTHKTDQMTKSITAVDEHSSLVNNIISSDFESAERYDFETIEISGYKATEQALQHCQMTVLRPYLGFLKLVGWRRLWTHDSEAPKPIKWCNIAYLSVFFAVLIYTCVAQILTCFLRTQAAAMLSPNQSSITCTNKVISGSVLKDIILLIVYIWGAYLFLYLQPEYLSSLIERVFLSCSGASTKNYLKTLIRKLQIILLCGCIWLLLTIATSIMRMFSLHLLDPQTTISTLLPKSNNTRYIHDVERYILVISSLFGFFAFDALYATVVINYVSQSELIIYFLRSIMVKARVKSQQLNELIKDIFHAHGILQVFNGHLSYIVSLSMFICVSDVISSFLNLYTLRDNGTSLGYAVGLCNIIQWFILAISPVIQAARLTKECHKLRQLGLEVSARPFTYKDTPQDALDSFLQYTSSTKYGAKLVGVVIHPKYLAVLLFGLGLFFTLYTFSHTPWL